MNRLGSLDVMAAYTSRVTALGNVAGVTEKLPRLLSTWQPPQTDLNRP
jgi:hypothetical protein